MTCCWYLQQAKSCDKENKQECRLMENIKTYRTSNFALKPTGGLLILVIQSFTFAGNTLMHGKKENQILLIYKEIQSGAVAKSYMRKGFLIYFPKYEEAVRHIYMT